MPLMFEKGSPDQARKKRRAKRNSTGKVDPESKLQEAADNLYRDLGIKALRIPDALFTIINTIPKIPEWIRIFINTHLSGWSDKYPY